MISDFAMVLIASTTLIVVAITVTAINLGQRPTQVTIEYDTEPVYQRPALPPAHVQQMFSTPVTPRALEASRADLVLPAALCAAHGQPGIGMVQLSGGQARIICRTCVAVTQGLQG